jgi:DNA invertase Pin-like site-specific DNA recombinase
MGRRYGYARVDEGAAAAKLRLLWDELLDHGCFMVRDEHVDGRIPAAERPALMRLLDLMESGDSLVAVDFEQVARSPDDLLRLIHRLARCGIHLVIARVSLDTALPEGRSFVGMLEAYARFGETQWRRRQRAGIERARIAGRYRGRRPIPEEKIQAVTALVETGRPVAEACREIGIGRATWYRAKAGRGSEGR